MSGADVITFVSHTSKPGGGELALRRYLEATSLRVRLVTLEAGGVWNDLSVEVVPVRGVTGLRSALRGSGLVVANSMRAAFLTALVLPRRGRLVYWVRDGLTHSAMSPLALALTKHVTARRADHYIANSEWTAGTVRAALGVASERVDIAYSMCGVTEDMLDRPPRTRPHEPLRLLFLGRLSPWKAPDVAVRALPVLKQLGVEATLTVAGAAHFGEDAYVGQLNALVNAESAATLVGHVDDVPALLEQHDILLHCSTVPEPFGQVIVQGLAAGVPVLATDQGGPREVMGDAAPVSLLHTPGDPETLAVAIRCARNDYAELTRWVRSRAVDFTDEVLLRRADQVLSSRLAYATGERHLGGETGRSMPGLGVWREATSAARRRLRRGLVSAATMLADLEADLDLRRRSGITIRRRSRGPSFAVAKNRVLRATARRADGDTSVIVKRPPVRLVHASSQTGLMAEARVLRSLVADGRARGGFPTVLGTGRGRLLRGAVLVMEELPGEMISRPDWYDHEALDALAEAYARVHSACVDTGPLPHQDHPVMQLSLRLFNSLPPSVKDEVQSAGGMPTALVHGDPYPGNWLWTLPERSVSLVDWGDAHLGWPSLEIARCGMFIAERSGEEAGLYLLARYLDQGVRPPASTLAAGHMIARLWPRGDDEALAGFAQIDERRLRTRREAYLRAVIGSTRPPNARQPMI